jgi:hypothetical protein
MTIPYLRFEFVMPNPIILYKVFSLKIYCILRPILRMQYE